MILIYKLIDFITIETLEGKAIYFMIIGGFSFAAMGALTHGLGKYMDWAVIALFRMIFSFIVTYSWAARSGKKPLVLNRALLWVRCIIGSIAMLATFYSLTMLPVSDVSVITETRPIWVALLAAVYLGEKNTKYIWISMILGLVGVLLIEKPHFEERNFAVFAALFASLLGAVVMICLRKLRDLDSRTIVTQFSGTASIIAFTFILFFRDLSEVAKIVDPKVIIMIIGIGVFGTLGQLAMTKAFALGKASTVSTAGLLKVGFSAGFDVLIWNYVFKSSTILGMILILGSTTLLFRKSNNIKTR
ncbi:MAG: EamA family transporter [Candidatus Dadabacteria bacterium]|nr:EamA family transporter [Candidatus Dadabacteria bacterium]NIQ13413.1 EamA family transporter [Candidatus Dadabacteria bacterium]